MKKKNRKAKKKMNKDKTKYVMIIVIIILAGLNIVLSTALILSSTKNKNNVNCNLRSNGTVTYGDVEDIINNKKSALIYYYNSNSSNNNNIEIKNYLDELGIKYYLYDDVNIDKEEYSKLLELLDINSELFGLPAIIYINDGKMYGNLINIDNKESVKRFIDNYDLYTIK